MISRFALYVAISILSSAVLAAAVPQERASSTATPVNMVVTVEARHGYDTPVVNREDVMVYEGHDRDKVTDWIPAQGEHGGLDLFILIDDSSNVSLGSQIEDIRQFISSQPATTKIGVAYMQNGTAKILQTLSSDHAEAATALRLPLGLAGVNGSPYFSLSDLIKHWPESGDRREVLMVSDGIDRYWGSGPDDPYVRSSVEQSQRAGVVVFAIYTLGVGHYGHSFWRILWGQNYLSQIADETGGESYYLGSYGAPVSFVPYLDEVSHRLNHQYLLTFLAKPEKKAGMQRVRLTTEVPNVELVSADSVYVPAGSD
ncbi:MAG: vWA domain-containing protein [Terriglobales bacterium]